jgi:CxxC motif-containing protein (DUF1111 family)
MTDAEKSRARPGRRGAPHCGVSFGLAVRVAAAMSILAVPALAQTQTTVQSAVPSRPAVDPGVRAGAAGAGGAIVELTQDDQDLFHAAQQVFEEIDAVANGLGPRFNLNGCAGCHAQPAVGGSSPATNPEIAVATLAGATNSVPSFITATGPVREARFVKNADGTPDGGVHALFVITGRSDAPKCRISQPDFASQTAKSNVIFRIPTPLFGLGLVENIPDSDLIAAKAAGAAQQRALRITGRFNRSGNDGTITRFGWKAQNKSLLIFAGEAYNVEQGVTNELFPNERETDPGCQFNALPEDVTRLRNTTNSGSPASDFSSDVVNFAAFVRFLAPPTPQKLDDSARAGSQTFAAVGCGACHLVQQFTAAASPNEPKTSFQPFSDFALHRMGAGLADGISQGGATGDEFRTAPLWGLGQRIFLLHDGRTGDLVTAIREHDGVDSEASAVIANFDRLSAQQRQDLLNFLRSL